jgi:4-oxalocrotonate tautomerase family enzyme
MPTVLVYWSPGRSPRQKADVIRGITDSLVEHGGARRDDVLVIFQDIEPGNAGRGGEVLQAPLDVDNVHTDNGLHADGPD